jgi:7-cyano-7-deazaguanine synthase in queuosine biosynthesis
MQKNISIPYKTYQGTDVTNIDIWCSGGIDSTLLLYMIVKKMQEENHPGTLQPICVDRRKEVLTTKIVIDKIIELTQFKNINELIIVDHIDDDLKVPIEKYELERATEGKTQLTYTGINKNPPPDWPKEDVLEEDVRGENAVRILEYYSINVAGNKEFEQWWKFPLISTNKKEIAKLYKEYNLLDNLLPLTVSCSRCGAYGKYNTWPEPCGKCRQCKQKFWGFNFY